MNEAQAYGVFCGMAGVFGALFGSFLNVCILRIPEDRSVVWPGSACPKCGTDIKPYDNVPILAWFWLRGRCRACGTPISPLYPTIEALFAVLIVLLFRRVIPDLYAFDLPHLAALAWYGWLLFSLAALTFIDLKHAIIPDQFSIYSVPVGVGGAWLLGWLGYTEAVSWQQSVVGAAAGGLSLLAITRLYQVIRKEEGMGMGDVKLMALFGSYFGAYPALFAILMIASLLGSIVGASLALIRRKGLRMGVPFGPFLAFGALMWLFFADFINIERHLRFDLLF
jgi:leader peptidase (prepilin peptidase) / N-methyltransferase